MEEIQLPPYKYKYELWYRFRSYACEECIDNFWEICDTEDEMNWKFFISAEKYNLIEAINKAKLEIKKGKNDK